jgi:hypothetical protein
MKKLVFILAICAVVAFPSCKKCTTCVIKAGSVELSPADKCGTERQVKLFEEEQAEKAAKMLDDGLTGARAYCTRY